MKINYLSQDSPDNYIIKQSESNEYLIELMSGELFGHFRHFPLPIDFCKLNDTIFFEAKAAWIDYRNCNDVVFPYIVSE